MPTDPNIIIMPAVRLSYPHLFKPHAQKGTDNEPTFQANFILDYKKHAELIKKIEITIARVALDKFLKKMPLKHKALHDGNEMMDKEGYGDGTMFIRAWSDKRPSVVDSDRVTPLNEESRKIYGGCFVNASIRLYAWGPNTGGCGVSADLRAVSFHSDGPSLGGSGPVDTESEFADLPDDSGAGKKAAPSMEDF